MDKDSEKSLSATQGATPVVDTPVVARPVVARPMADIGSVDSRTFTDKMSDKFKNWKESNHKTVENVKSVAQKGKNQLHSVIYTFMDAINHSFVGGLYGLKVELENILQEQKQKGGEESNEGMEFIGELANFISSFLEYVRINKKLKLGATKPSDNSGGESDEMKNKIEALNYAFRNLAFTYGQLSGRTIHYISKFLSAGGAPKVGFFDPISFAGIGNTVFRATPVGSILGNIFDSITNVLGIAVEASKKSFKSLEEERKFASDYMQYVLNETQNEMGGGGEKYIEKTDFVQLHDVKNKKKSEQEDAIKDLSHFKQTIKSLINKTGTHAKTIHVITEKDLENNLKDIEEALAEYEHIKMLQTLFDGIEKDNLKHKIYFTSNKKSDDKLTNKDKKLLKKFLNKKTVGSDKSYYKILKGKFTDNLKLSVDTSDNTGNKLKRNIGLYNILKNFLNSESVSNINDNENKDIAELRKLVDDDDLNEKAETDTEKAEKAETEKAKILETAKKLLDIAEKEKERIEKTDENLTRKKKIFFSSSKDVNVGSFLKKEYGNIKKELDALIQSNFKQMTSSFGVNGYRKIKGLLTEIKRSIKADITSFMSMVTNEEGTVTGEEDMKTTKEALRKILKFIRYRDFEKYIIDKKKKKGGGNFLHNSTIRKRINNATRRIHNTIENFNNTTRNVRSGKNIRRRKTRRIESY